MLQATSNAPHLLQVNSIRCRRRTTGSCTRATWEGSSSGSPGRGEREGVSDGKAEKARERWRAHLLLERPVRRVCAHKSDARVQHRTRAGVRVRTGAAATTLLRGGNPTARSCACRPHSDTNTERLRRRGGRCSHSVIKDAAANNKNSVVQQTTPQLLSRSRALVLSMRR